MRTNEVTLQADAEYVAFLDMYAAEDVAETKSDDAYWANESHGAWEDGEGSATWSCRFESSPEAVAEMEADDVRCGGSFSELLAYARADELEYQSLKRAEGMSAWAAWNNRNA